MRKRGWHLAGHRALVWLGALGLLVIYFAVVTRGFTTRPDWFDAWQAARAIR